MKRVRRLRPSQGGQLYPYTVGNDPFPSYVKVGRPCPKCGYQWCSCGQRIAWDSSMSEPYVVDSRTRKACDNAVHVETKPEIGKPEKIWVSEGAYLHKDVLLGDHGFFEARQAYRVYQSGLIRLDPLLSRADPIGKGLKFARECRDIKVIESAQRYFGSIKPILPEVDDIVALREDGKLKSRGKVMDVPGTHGNWVEVIWFLDYRGEHDDFTDDRRPHELVLIRREPG